MAIESYIRVYDDIVPPELCKSIIAKFDEDIDGQIPSTIVNGTDTKIRDSISLDMTGRAHVMPDYWMDSDLQIANRGSALWERYYKELELNPHVVPNTVDEGYSIHRYDAGSGHYDLHVDCGSLSTAHRFLSMMIYLNEVKGGETNFPNWGVKVSPREGRIAVFPSAYTHRHQALPPTDKFKYVIPVFLAHGSN